MSLIARSGFRLLTREPLRIDAGARLTREAFGAAADAVIGDEIGFDPNPEHALATGLHAACFLRGFPGFSGAGAPGGMGRDLSSRMMSELGHPRRFRDVGG
jgi:hypothetical protein